MSSKFVSTHGGDGSGGGGGSLSRQKEWLQSALS